MIYNLTPIINYTKIDNSDNTILKYSFPSITDLNGTDSLVFKANEYLTNITEYFDLDDTIKGDTSYINTIKEFRYSYDNITYSDWTLLTLENLQAITINEQIDLEFKYTNEPNITDYNLVLDIKKPNVNGWFNVVESNSIESFTFDKDYPETGDYEYVLGYGTNGQYHIDTSTSKIYVKENGVWTGGVHVVRDIMGNYIPTKFNDVILNDIFIASIESKVGVVPINDYILNIGVDIRFSSKNNTPLEHDTIFINPELKGIDMIGLEQLRINYTRPTITNTPTIYLEELNLTINQYINTYSTEPLFCLNNVGDNAIFKPQFLLKLYSVDSFMVEVDGICSTSWNPCLDIKFRYSHNSRKWETNWLYLSLANLKCIKPNANNFFYIEFLFTKICDNNGKPICVSDIIINGNIQNVSNDYDKLNRFGLRGDCDYKAGNGTDTTSGLCNSDIVAHDWITDLETCGTNSGTLDIYQNKQLIAFNEKVSNDVSNLFGWNVDYYRTQANEAGVDNVLHEYGTFDTIDMKQVKILPADNKFPEDTISFNMLGLDLFDNFEVHITKKEFYRAFGVGTRPANTDFLFICQINKFYKVEHSQSFRDFMNSSVFFKLSLSKKEDDSHVDNGSYTDGFESLVKNNQIDVLFGKDTKENIDNVINQPLLQNLTELQAIDTKLKYEDNTVILTNTNNEDEIIDYIKPQPLQTKVMVQSIEKDLENMTTVIARNYYDLGTRLNNVAIQYQYVDNDICDCCNRAFTVWFSLYKYEQGMIYNLIDNFDNLTNKGYKIDFVDGRLIINWFGDIYNMDVHISLNKWYGLVVNIYQDQRKIEVDLYKRKSEHNCTSSDLDIVDSHVFTDIVPNTYKGNLVLKVNGSYLYWTNMRLFNKEIPKNKHVLVLNQMIVKNSEYLLSSDNGDKSVKSGGNFKY